MYHDQDASATFTWYFTVPEGEAGNHNVYAWWSEDIGRAPNAPYTINYEGGSETIYVTQQMKGGQWNYFGQLSV